MTDGRQHDCSDYEQGDVEVLVACCASGGGNWHNFNNAFTLIEHTAPHLHDFFGAFPVRQFNRRGLKAIDTLVDELACGLRARGIAPGDRIAVLARNSLVFVAIRFAIARCGAVLVPINFMLNVEEVSYVLDHSEARLLFLDASTLFVGRNAARVVGIASVYAMMVNWLRRL